MRKCLWMRVLGVWLLALVGCGEDKEPTSFGPVTNGPGPTGLPIGPGVAGGPGDGNGLMPVGGGGGPVATPVGPNTVPVGPDVPGGPMPVGPNSGDGDGQPMAPMIDVSSSWPSFGGDLSHTRSNPTETRVHMENVATLAPAIEISAPGVTATPALYKGVIYWSDWGGFVHATDALDPNHRELWVVDRSANGGGYTGSPAVTDKLVYVANRNGLLSAFDRETGMPVWEQMLDAGVHTHIWSSPVVAEEDNVLVVGVGGLGTRDNGVALPRSQLESFRGWVEGRDAMTGEHLWRFDVTAMPSGAGVSVWSSAAMDTTRKLAFIGTGNNYYRPVSSYSDSLLALDYTTGTYKWHAQFTQNDAWTVGTILQGGVDGDVGATPNLFAINGRDVVGVGDKTGKYYVHDRETGERVWSQSLTRGGYQGGVMAPAAYQDGVVYVVSNNDTASSTVFALDADNGGDVLWEQDLADPTFGGPAIGNGILFVGDTGGHLRGYDAMNGTVVWQETLPGDKGGGFAFAGGVLLTGFGYHFSESRREPLRGGLVAFAIGGAIELEERTDVSDCMENVAVTADATFTNVYQGVLCPLGCTKVCHSTSAEAGLNLEGKATAYQSLFNVAAKGVPCVGKGTLVVPNNPSGSLLHGKLTPTPACGVSMPPGDPSNSPVTPAMLEAVRAWIAAGAPNN